MADIIWLLRTYIFKTISIYRRWWPADGVQILYPAAMGDVRGHYSLDDAKVTAPEALQIGINEVHPRDKLIAGAAELAEQL